MTGFLILLTLNYAEEEMRRAGLVNTALFLALFALGTSIVIADTDWGGSATGNCSGYSPWTNWVGTLHTDEVPVQFRGYWGGDVTDSIKGIATYDSQTGRYNISLGQWAYRGTWTGYWNGYFYPDTHPRDTANGYWWAAADSSSCNGILWGDLAGD